MDVIEVNNLIIPVQQIQSIKVKTEAGIKQYVLLMPYGEVDLTPEQTTLFEEHVEISSRVNLNPDRGGLKVVLAKMMENSDKK